jgi:hypothetical protein
MPQSINETRIANRTQEKLEPIQRVAGRDSKFAGQDYEALKLASLSLPNRDELMKQDFMTHEPSPDGHKADVSFSLQLK